MVYECPPGKEFNLDISYSVTFDTLESQSPMPCSNEMNLDFDNCVHEKLQDILLSNFSCLVPFLPENSYPICMENSTKMTEIMLFYKHHSTNAQRKHCKLPCSSMEIIIGSLTQGSIHKPRGQGKMYS